MVAFGWIRRRPIRRVGAPSWDSWSRTFALICSDQISCVHAKLKSMGHEDPRLAELLRSALLSAYQSPKDIRRTLRLSLGLDFESQLPPEAPFDLFVHQVVQLAIARDELIDLCEAVLRDRPRNLTVQALQRALHEHHSPIHELRKLIAAGRCVLFVGAGVSNFSGMPTWAELIPAIIARAVAETLLRDDERQHLTSLSDHGELDQAADMIQESIGIEKMRDYLHKELAWSAEPHEIHRNLASLPFSAAVTGNWDDLIERAFDKRQPKIVTWDRAKEASECLDSLVFFLLKLSGDLSRAESILLNRRSLEGAIAKDKALNAFIEQLLTSRTIVFVGASPETIEVLMRFGANRTGQESRHYAFIGTNYAPEWESRSAPLSRFYGVTLIPYGSGAELVTLIQQLQMEGNEESAVSGLAGPPVLKRVVFQNVGPFESLEVKFEPRWNVLLGDNGVGKSSVLRALGVALGGAASEPWADRIIKVGCESANITLETTHYTHRISIFRRSSGPGAELRCVPLSPMAPLLILGFPPLRAVNWGGVSSILESKSGPDADDILPLVAGGADLRLDSLKQWIVNIDYRIKDAKAEGRDAGPFQKLIEDFFEVVCRVTEGLPIRFGRVDPATRQVTVVTSDAEVPIELVSQGTASLISWVGVLLQRLYDIHGPSEPRLRNALVLIDEIDAHMHPKWQQSIIHHLQDIFPNIQVVATAHSPLVVAGRSADEVTIFSRDPTTGKISADRASISFKGMRSDQILTSQAFGLDAARDYDTTAKLSEYRALLQKAELTDSERNKLNALRSDEAILRRSLGETPLQASAYDLLSESIDMALSAKSPEESAKLRQEIEFQLREARLGSDLQ